MIENKWSLRNQSLGEIQIEIKIFLQFQIDLKEFLTQESLIFKNVKFNNLMSHF